MLDAGHGGEDGGAVSLTGVPESQINLAIVQKLDLLLGLCGQSPVVMRQLLPMSTSRYPRPLRTRPQLPEEPEYRVVKLAIVHLMPPGGRCVKTG